MYATRILGTGSYLPEKTLSNADLEKLVETSDQWIVERTGIRYRHVAAPEEATSDLAYQAAIRALKSANVSPQDLEMIIVGTVYGDQQMPSTACMLQAKLGARDVMVFDLSAACTGFLYGTTIADQFIRTGLYSKILVVGSEILTRLLNYKDRETCILFGDGAGAMVFGRADHDSSAKIYATHMHADGSLADLLVLPAGGTRQPITHEVLNSGGHWMKMKGREIFKNAVRAMVSSSQQALKTAGMTVNDIDWLVPHQANLRIMQAVAENLGIPVNKVISNVDHMGNTSAATIPVAFDEAVINGRINRGDTILMTAFGAGLTFGSVLLKY